MWHSTLRGRDALWHSGHISGFSAYLLYLPGSRISVAILQNADQDAALVDPSETARKLAAFAIGDPFPPINPIAVDQATLLQAEGAYGTDPPGPRAGSIEGRRILRVVDGKLTIARTGDIRSELIPIAADSFQVRNGQDRLQVQRDDAGKVSAIRFFSAGEGGGRLLARVVQPQAGSQIVLPPEALQRLTGTYGAEGVVLRIYMENGQLRAEINGQPPAVTLLPEAPDRFFAGEVDAAMAFESDGKPPRSVTLSQGDMNVRFWRQP